MPGKNTRTEDCLWLLGSLCNLYRIPFDAALVASQFPPSYTLATFHEAARALGFKTGVHPLPSDGWQKLPFPCIAFLKPQAQNKTGHTAAPPGDHQVIPFPAPPEKPPPQAESFSPSPLMGEGRGEGEKSNPSASLTPILIVKTDGQQLLYFRTNSQTPETLSIADATSLLEPELILIAREYPGADGQPEDIAGFETEKPQFGFLLGIIGIMSLLVAPVFRDKLNQQFMLGARNQAYLAAGFSTKQTGNSYNVVANGIEQVMTLSILIVGALLVMQNDGFTVGMLWSPSRCSPGA